MDDVINEKASSVLEEKANEEDYKDVAKEVLEVCKEIYNSELDRSKSVDTKISALLTVTAAIITIFGYLFTPQCIVYQSNVLNNILLVLNIFIILGLFSVLILLILGLISRKMSAFSIDSMSAPNFIGKNHQEAIYILIVTYEDVIKKNYEVIRKKHLYFKAACIVLAASFGLISLKVVIEIFIQ